MANKVRTVKTVTRTCDLCGEDFSYEKRGAGRLRSECDECKAYCESEAKTGSVNLDESWIESEADRRAARPKPPVIVKNEPGRARPRIQQRSPYTPTGRGIA